MNAKKDLSPMQELECRALQQATGLVLETNGWTGEIKVKPYVILRCGGMAVSGEISKNGNTSPVDTIELINHQGRQLIELRHGNGYPKQRMTCTATVSVIVVSQGPSV